MIIVESQPLDVTTIASFIHQNTVSFNVADSLSFAAMVEQCIQFGQRNPGHKYNVPNRRRISGQLLDSAYEDTAASVQQIMDRAKKNDVTLTSDGWSDVQRRPITKFSKISKSLFCFQVITMYHCVFSCMLLNSPFGRRYPLRHCLHYDVKRNRASRRNSAIGS